MPAWFDLMSLDPNGVEDDKGIQKSKAVIVKLIEEEISNGIDPSRLLFKHRPLMVAFLGSVRKN